MQVGVEEIEAGGMLILAMAHQFTNRRWGVAAPSLDSCETTITPEPCERMLITLVLFLANVFSFLQIVDISCVSPSSMHAPTQPP